MSDKECPNDKDFTDFHELMNPCEFVKSVSTKVRAVFQTVPKMVLLVLSRSLQASTRRSAVACSAFLR